MQTEYRLCCRCTNAPDAQPSKDLYGCCGTTTIVQSSGNCRLGITFRSSGNRQPLVYCDSDRGGDESRKSTAGHILILAGGPIAWRSELIDDYPLSTCEAEIRAINAAKPAAVTAIYIQHLLEEVLAHLPPVDIDPAEIPLKL
jgi:hypothetical protein